MLQFVYDLWTRDDPLERRTPKSELIAQTDDGPLRAATRFVEAFVCKEEQAAFFAAIQRYHSETIGAQRKVTFCDTFLHVAGMTRQGLLVVSSKNGWVKSVDVQNGSTTRSVLNKQEACACFDQGMLAIVVDPEEECTVTVHGWNLEKLVCRDVPSARALETQSLIQAASKALLNETWVSHQWKAANATASPPTAA